MRNNLSKELQKYYTHQGNRIVFANGMTLNKLAWEMWEKLGFGEIDPSALSRVLSGNRTFSPKQLRVFCQILGINGFKKDLLFQSLYEDLLLKTGVDSSLLCSKDDVVIKLVEENFAKIRAAQERGLSILVIEWSQLLVDKIDEYLPHVYTTENQKKLLALEGKLLVVLDQCRIVSNEPDKLLASISKSSRKLREIGEYLNNRDLIGASYLNLGNGYYDCENYEESLDCFEKASSLMSLDFGNDISEAPLRALALSLVYMAKEEKYSSVKKSLIANLSRYPIDIKCFVTEALGRSEAILGNKGESEKWFTESERYLEIVKSRKLRYGHLREVQLIRSLIEAGIHLEADSDSEYLSRLGNMGIELAKNNGYIFYASKIKKLLDSKGLS